MAAPEKRYLQDTLQRVMVYDPATYQQIRRRESLNRKTGRMILAQHVLETFQVGDDGVPKLVSTEDLLKSADRDEDGEIQ